MNSLKEFDDRINLLRNKESEIKGVFKTHTSKLKEMGINNVKEADSKIEELSSEIEKLNNQIKIMELDIEEKLSKIEEQL